MTGVSRLTTDIGCHGNIERINKSILWNRTPLFRFTSWTPVTPHCEQTQVGLVWCFRATPIIKRQMKMRRVLVPGNQVQPSDITSYTCARSSSTREILRHFRCAALPLPLLAARAPDTNGMEQQAEVRALFGHVPATTAGDKPQASPRPSP